MISLRQLRYALAVSKHRHFKRAAQECAISQSALSTAISELENTLGFLVFERDNKKVFVTPLGQQALARAQAVVDDVAALESIGKTHSDPLQFPLSIGVIPTIGPYLLPKVLPAVRAQYPEARLTLVEAQSKELLERVRQGELDTAILALPYDIDGLHAFEFWSENFMWVVHKDDPLAKRKRVKADTIDMAQLMLLEDGHCLKDHALAACRLNAGMQASNVASTSLTTLVQMVAGKLGSTLVPEMALEGLVAPMRELVAIKLFEPGPHRRLAFVTRLNFTDVASVDCLANCFARVLKKAERERRS